MITFAHFREKEKAAQMEDGCLPGCYPQAAPRERKRFSWIFHFDDFVRHRTCPPRLRGGEDVREQPSDHQRQPACSVCGHVRTAVPVRDVPF